MIERKFSLLAIAAAVAIPPATGAQVASRLELGALSTGSAQDAPEASSIFRLSPSATFDHSRLRLSAATAAWLRNGSWSVAEGHLNAMVTSPTVYGVRAELLGNASRAFEEHSLGSDHLDVQTRVHLLINERGGIWLGGGTARPWRVAVVSSVEVLNGGVWFTGDDRAMTATVTRYNITKSSVRKVADGVTMCGSRVLSAREAAFGVDGCREYSHVTDLDLTARWDFLGVEYTGGAGYRFGKLADVSSDSREWATMTATRWIAPRAAILVGGGRQPANPARGLPARTYATLGMVFSYLPVRVRPAQTIPTHTTVASFDMRELEVGKQQITVRMGSVERVEITGSFSDWEPMALTRRPGTDIWELQLQLPVGIHRINVRIDKAQWTVPPGLASQPDGFGGEVGILVVSK